MSRYLVYIFGDLAHELQPNSGVSLWLGALQHRRFATPDEPRDPRRACLGSPCVRSGVNEGKTIGLPALPLEMNQRKFGLRSDLPTQGADSIRVLQEVGFSDEEIQSMLDEGLA